ncbi:MAG: DNA polymerase sliding clamp [Methanocellales archaeon]|nr:DNA polymerase sliding clamp [Methanocellales archaeon]MDD3421000.1 DNA polymerase sliding clamp [Methanocellales archaeon]MDD4898107.1 DNA polymerase sliding clamp [Methanocellales archaeon]MDD5447269.1 DNA polymerase sliding clamp [Methanocellales archaeon]
MVFRAVIDADILKDSIEAISTLVDEAKFKLGPEGISLMAVDPANVAMVSFELSSKAFDSYESTEGEIGLDLIKLVNVLGMAKSSDKVGLELNEKTHKLSISMGGLSYTLSLLDPSSIRKEPKVPSLDLPVKATLNGNDLRKAVKAAETVSDHIILGVDGDVLFMEAKGDTDQVRLGLTKDELIDLTASGPARSLFSLDYLSDMSKSLKKVNEITIHLGKDYPIKINFMIANGNGKVGYLLAPRIES